MAGVGRLEALTRTGFAARGIMYLLIGLLAFQSGRTEDGAGALATLDSDVGRLAVGLMALGFVGYGLWRLSEAAIDTQGYGRDPKGVGKRVSGAISGLVHLSLALVAAKLALDLDTDEGDGTRASAAAAMDLPGGSLLLAAAAAALLVAGAFQLLRAVNADFLKHLDARVTGQAWVIWLGRGGHAARGIVFLLMGWFFLRAAWSSDAGEAGGIGQALDSLPDSLRPAVAVGLFLFGLFSLVEARHRRINDPRVLERLRALG